MNDIETNFRPAHIPGPLGAPGNSGLNMPIDKNFQPLNYNDGASTQKGKSNIKKLYEPRALPDDIRSGAILSRFPSSDAFSTRAALHYNGVRQGGILNCPLPAMLAGMLRTNTLAKHIKILEINKPAYSIHGKNKIKVNRYFRITFPGKKKVEVTDLFWTTSSKKFIYAYFWSPNPGSSYQSLWVSLIEKAYIQLVKTHGTLFRGYEKLNSPKIGPTANDIVEDLTGVSQAQVSELKKLNDKDLKNLLIKAKTVPMIANLPGPTANQAHAYMVEGPDDEDPDYVGLYNSLNGEDWSLTIEFFLQKFQYAFYP